MANSKLLKEAIADAKAVKETALANAKLALEEAFTPRLQSMLSAKLAEELEGEEEEMTEEEEMPVDTEEAPVEEGEDMEDEMPVEEGEEMEHEEEAPVEEGEEAEDDLDLEEIIRELEGADEAEEEMAEAEDEEEMTEGEDEEDVDINEIIRSLREEDETEEEAPAAEEPAAEDHSEDLEEAYNVIRFLKGKINEVNLLNAKLLYSNKLFRNFSLNESQKMKVIENFDRAFNLREVKLVFSTLAESFKNSTPRKIVKESFASKPVASTKPAKQVLSEGQELAERFKKLAGLSKRK
jgi:hypothetical protein